MEVKRASVTFGYPIPDPPTRDSGTLLWTEWPPFSQVSVVRPNSFVF